MGLELFDPNAFSIGGISVIAFVFGAVQFIKEMFNMNGKAVTALSLFMGIIVMAIVQAIQFLPPEWIPYVEAVFSSFAFGLAASGFYKFARPANGQ